MSACVPSRKNRGSDSEKPTLAKPRSRKGGGLKALPQAEIRFEDDEEPDKNAKVDEEYDVGREFSLVDFPEEIPMPESKHMGSGKMKKSKSKTTVSVTKGNSQKSLGDSQ